jgi:hypothetical protein
LLGTSDTTKMQHSKKIEGYWGFKKTKKGRGFLSCESRTFSRTRPL